MYVNVESQNGKTKTNHHRRSHFSTIGFNGVHILNVLIIIAITIAILAIRNADNITQHNKTNSMKSTVYFANNKQQQKVKNEKKS